MLWQITLVLSAALVAVTSTAQITLEHDLLALPDNGGTKPLRPLPENIDTINQQLDVINLIGKSEENRMSREIGGEKPQKSAEQNTERNQVTTEKNMITEDQGNVSQKSASNPNDDNDELETGPGSGNNDGVPKAVEGNTEGDSGVIEGDGEGNHEGGGGGNNESGGSESQEGGGSGNNEPDGGGNNVPGDGGNNEPGGGGNNEPGGGGNNEPGGGGNNEPGGGGNNEPGGGGNNEPGGGESNEGSGSGNQEGGGNGNPEAGGGVNSKENSAQSHQNIDEGDDQNIEEGGVQNICDGVQQEDVTVNTTIGQVRGHCWQNNSKIISYIDIPYGSFDGMFEDPVLHESFESIHEVEYHKKLCPQMQDNEYVGDKDCLTLSIFTPLQARDASVLFHIHEGYFNKGSGDPAIYGPEHLVLKGIILVLPNYRLGPLGFLCLQNTTAPGNAALKDLTLALTWIKANIQRFGGNSSNIAVSGEGTAGALAGYLALSPLSKNYVSKVITESGSVLSHWALDRTPINTANTLARAIGEFETWQNVEISTIIKAGKDLTFTPCVERNISNVTNFMLATPWTMMENQELETAFIIGSAQYAGVHDFFNNESISVQGLIEDVGSFLPNDLKFQTSNERNIVAERIKKQYFNESADLTDVEKLAEYFTDFSYLGPGIRTSRSLVNAGATVYFYEFSFVGGFNRELISLKNPVEGAIKGDIVGYLFACEYQNESNLQERDRRMVDQLTELWTTFLKDGVPTVSAQNNKIMWNKLENTNDSNENWLSIDDTIIMKKGLHLERLRLWTEIYDKHFIERNLASGFSPSVNTVLILQIIFLFSFFRNATHFIH